MDRAQEAICDLVPFHINHGAIPLALWPLTDLIVYKRYLRFALCLHGDITLPDGTRVTENTIELWWNTTMIESGLRW